MSLPFFTISYSSNLKNKYGQDLFLANHYIYHLLEKNNEFSNYNDIKVAPFTIDSKETLVKDSNFVDEKYNFYIKILGNRLNAIHNKKYNVAFWKKCLSLAFVRHLTAVYDLFKICEQYFNPEKYSYDILSKDDFYVPLDFEESRQLFQNSDHGFEQLFSIYIDLFYPNSNPVFNADFFIEIKTDGILPKVKSIKEKMKKSFFYKLIKKQYDFIKRKRNIKNGLEVGLLGVVFSSKNINYLIDESDSKIFPIDYHIELVSDLNKIDFRKRYFLSKFNNDFDNFDKFFFRTIMYCFPIALIENFSEIEFSYLKKIKEYPSLKYVVSEIWITNTYISIFLALLKERNITHICNEHNGLLHPFAGSYISHVIELSDIFVSLGWNSAKYKNFVKGSSLYEFTIEKNYDKKIDILHVSGISQIKMSHISGAWGVDQQFSPKYFDFLKLFFKNLSNETIKNITYRKYPYQYVEHLKYYDKEHILRDFLGKIEKYADISITSKEQMLQSRLVIIDYISTSYLESILMNIPTVFFWDINTYYLNDEFLDFFDPLINTGICQTDPIRASHFVESIKDNPEKWWFSDNTQKGKNEFLIKNIGKSEALSKYLLSLIN